MLKKIVIFEDGKKNFFNVATVFEQNLNYHQKQCENRIAPAGCVLVIPKKNGRKSSFFHSGFHQIIVKSPQKKTAMTFETDAHLGAGV